MEWSRIVQYLFGYYRLGESISYIDINQYMNIFLRISFASLVLANCSRFISFPLHCHTDSVDTYLRYPSARDFIHILLIFIYIEKLHALRLYILHLLGSESPYQYWVFPRPLVFALVWLLASLGAWESESLPLRYPYSVSSLRTLSSPLFGSWCLPIFKLAQSRLGLHVLL